MDSLHARFEQGSEWDSRILLLAVVLIILSFVSTYQFGFWDATDTFFVPLLVAGISLVAINVVFRLLRPSLDVCIFSLDGGSLEIRPVKNLQFSGWVALNKVTVDTSDISRVRVHNFYNPGTNAGMYWVCIELADGRVVEYNLDSHGLIKDICAFFDSALPQIALAVDKRVKASLSR